jgi:hypothetical protein
VAAVTAAPSRRSVLAHRLQGFAVAAAVRLVTPHKAVLANLRSIPLTVAGVAAIDFAAFHLAHGWGWLVTGVLLVVVEHLIADER